MHSADAHIPTGRAERYLEQLCSHLGAMQRMRHLPAGGHGGAGMPRVENVEQAPGRAVIHFADGSWTLAATAEALALRVEAADPAALEKLKATIAARIEKIGRRDNLVVEWHEPDTPETGDTRAAQAAPRPVRERVGGAGGTGPAGSPRSRWPRRSTSG
jgi:hypothetical protein